MKRLGGIFFLIIVLYPGVTLGQPGREIVILFTHDLHSHYLPHQTDIGGPNQGGYAKISSLIKSFQAKYGNNLLILDAGDFSMGTLFHTLFRKEASELMLMSAMGYEVITLGNHEFDFHPDGLADSLKTAHEKIKKPLLIVASNLSFGPPDPRDFKLREVAKLYPIREYVVVQKGGVKFGIFGLLGKDAWDDAPFARPLKFLDPIEKAKQTVKILKEKEQVDFVICLSHSGTAREKTRSEDENLARNVPEINLIVSGHTHTALFQPIIQGKTVIASAGRYGEYLGMVNFAFDHEGKSRLREYRLIPVTEHIPDDLSVSKIIDHYKHLTNSFFLAPYGLAFDGTVGEINFHTETLDRAYARQGETGLGNLITDAFRFAIKQAEGEHYEHVHLAIQPLGLIRSSFFPGKIKTDDVFRVLSLGQGPDGTPGYPLLTTYLSGKEIKKLMEIETTISRLKRDAHLQVSGVKVKYNPNRLPFDRVTDVELQEPDGTYRTVIPDRLYRVAMNYYSAQMVDYITRVSHGLLTMKPKDKRGAPISDVKESIIKISSPSSPGELKEWIALTMFIKSFPDTNGNGIPDVPPRYQAPEGRIMSFPSWHPVDLIRGATFITWATSLLFFGVVLLMIIALRFIWQHLKNRFRGA